MEIPYTVQSRPDTGVYNAKIGIWLFLASEVMLFGGLFSAYVLLRVGAAPGEWPHGWLNPVLGTVNTLILALSAITTLLAWVACKVGQFGKFRVFHACTLALALTFLCIKMYEYHDKLIHYEIQLTDGRIADGHMIENNPKDEEIKIRAEQIAKMENYGPHHNTFTAIYFTLTGLHALHILGGSLVIGYLWWRTAKKCGRRNRNDSPTASKSPACSGISWTWSGYFCSAVLYLT
ncbi:MAG: cytochrome c oxidase subunit 3 [Limisphaerales bacterium]